LTSACVSDTNKAFAESFVKITPACGWAAMSRKFLRIHNGIFIQAVLIVIGFTLIALALSVYVFSLNMRTVLMNEVENKAAVFISALEVSVRRQVTGREPGRLSELIQEQESLLKNKLNFTIIRAVVLDTQGRILDHMRSEKLGQIHSDEDLREVMATGRPLLRRDIKVLKEEPSGP
jgi:hypothetical protein